MKTELSSISQLPQLKRFACLSFYHWTELESLLEDSSRFISLSFIALQLYDSGDFKDQIEDMCTRRRITLEEWSNFWLYHYGDPAPAAGFLL